MSAVVAKAECKEELLNALYGEVTVKELEETDLGILTPHRAERKLVATPLLPPRTQGRIAAVLKKLRTTRNTGGLLFLEKIVVVFTPHVPDDVVGEVTIWVHDNMLPHLNSVGERVCFPLNAGPRLMAFYPPYSIPLSCRVGEIPRCLYIVSEYSGVNFASGASPFSLYIMWQPKIEATAHNYLPRSPLNLPICRHQVKNSLQSMAAQKSAISGAISTRFADIPNLEREIAEAQPRLETPGSRTIYDGVGLGIASTSN
ncbi:putative cell-to-cell movement protein [Opium poppy mosaic virus]|uniref:Cell-to-cell movement protein n=1 Tax=Opium poppy mosaic virus TaxID=473784 RepID=G0KUS7_9TOMB|nr:putative cell-to-cell movement protein [Opium poppy mosaic virus]AEJ80235.2 putative cell-to-cell movement protein [Opium poppy mosaic virus]